MPDFFVFFAEPGSRGTQRASALGKMCLFDGAMRTSNQMLSRAMMQKYMESNGGMMHARLTGANSIPGCMVELEQRSISFELGKNRVVQLVVELIQYDV